MAYPYVPTTRVDGELIDAAKYMADQILHATENRPSSIDDYSANVAQMRQTDDPGEAGSESLPVDLSGELTRLRFTIKELKDLIKGSAVAQWYTTLTTSDVGGIMPTGAEIPFGGIASKVPAGWLVEDGTAVSRTTYAALFAVLTFTQTGSTTNGSPVVTGLSSTADMFVGMDVEGTGIPANTTIASVDSGTQITLSANATATGTPTLRFFPHGNGDGTTTFNVPDARDRVTYGASTTKRVGSTGGSDTISTEQLPAHTHPAGTLATSSAGAHAHTQRWQAGDPGVIQDHAERNTSNGANVSSPANTTTTTTTDGAHTHSITGSTASTGSGDPFFPKYRTSLWIIKT